MTARPLRIALVVHGRFHLFDLGRALLAQGHDVWLFTNYPARVVARFGFPADRVRSFLAHGVLSRAAAIASARLGVPYPEPFVHEAFGRWAARTLAGQRWDVIHVLSGVGEEVLRAWSGRAVVALGRFSAHIRTQAELLEQEERRAGVPISRPSPWMIAREEREYALADHLMLLSSFSVRSFVERGFDPKRLGVYPMAAEAGRFRIPPEQAAARAERIRRGEPLRLLYVGARSYRKGLVDLDALARTLDPNRFKLRLVGPAPQESAPLLSRLPAWIEQVPSQPQFELSSQYAWGDVFVFPTIEDGAPTVLAQAQASGLPILTTPHCSGPDIVREGETGWVLPIRAPEAFAERLRWCDAHRSELARMAEQTYSAFRPRDWDHAANVFSELSHRWVEEKQGTPLNHA